MRAPWLADVLTDAGLTVVEVPGWHGRGRDMDTIHGVVCHDTITTSAWSDVAVDALLRDGRSDLPGPLSQLGVDREGRFRLVADGRSNHNGYGVWGNDAIGIEVYCAGGLKGREEPWNDAQREAVIAGARAILDHVKPVPSYWDPPVAGHRETDPGRKVDPYRIGMDAVRAAVRRGAVRTELAQAVVGHTAADLEQGRVLAAAYDAALVRVSADGRLSAERSGAPVDVRFAWLVGSARRAADVETFPDGHVSIVGADRDETAYKVARVLLNHPPDTIVRRGRPW